MRRFLKHTIVQNALSLYGIQIAEYAFPLVMVPFLARVLHPEGWSPVVIAQSFSGWMSLLLEYGFNMSATREIARYRDSAESKAEIVASVLGATGLLFFGAGIVMAICAFTVPVFQSHPDYFWWSALIALTNGIKPLWYFQGIENIRFPALLNLFVRGLFTASVFIVVRAENDGWKMLALQAVSGVLVTAVLFIWMYREIPVLWPTMPRAISALRMGFGLFLFRSAASLYTTANTFILGLFAPSSASFYGAPERINKAAQSFMQPLSISLFPRMSHLAVQNRDRAAYVARLSLKIFGGSSLVIAAGLTVLAGPIILILLGPDYGPAVPVFRVLAILIPLIALSNVLGVQWMLPLGMDRVFIRIVIVAGVFNVALAVILAPRFGPVGMAWAVVIAEGFVTLAQILVLHRSGKAFWRTGEQAA